MSKSKPEMVTMTFDVTIEDAEYLRAQKGVALGFCKAQAEAAGKALDARKSLYEKWQERIGKGWYASSWPQDTETEWHVTFGHNDDSSANECPERAKLMAAAPQLLEVVLATIADEGCYTQADAKVVRAAVPEDVADFLLGVKA